MLNIVLLRGAFPLHTQAHIEWIKEMDYSGTTLNSAFVCVQYFSLAPAVSSTGSFVFCLGVASYCRCSASSAARHQLRSWLWESCLAGADVRITDCDRPWVQFSLGPGRVAKSAGIRITGYRSTVAFKIHTRTLFYTLYWSSKVKFAAWPDSWRPPSADRLWPRGTTVNSRIWLAP